jgi:hypothetical protein
MKVVAASIETGHGPVTGITLVEFLTKTGKSLFLRPFGFLDFSL